MNRQQKPEEFLILLLKSGIDPRGEPVCGDCACSPVLIVYVLSDEDDFGTFRVNPGGTISREPIILLAALHSLDEIVKYLVISSVISSVVVHVQDWRERERNATQPQISGGASSAASKILHQLKHGRRSQPIGQQTDAAYRLNYSVHNGNAARKSRFMSS